MPDIAEPIYDSAVNELSVFPNLETAKDWLENNQLDTSGTTILVPFKTNNKIHFLKPSNPNVSSSKPENESTSYDANKDIRIIGAANTSHVHGLFENIRAALTTRRVPHLNELEGNTIKLADHGFIIIYKKGRENVGCNLFDLFEKEKEELIEEIKKAQTNEAPHINPAKFLEDLSTLALNLDIRGGMCYFFRTDKNGKQHVYREIFSQDADNTKLDRYLVQEAKWHESKRVKIKEHKWRDHHIIRFLIDWVETFAFAELSVLGAALVLWIFLIPLLGLHIAAAVAGGVAFVTILTINSIGFFKADKKMPLL